MNFDLNEEQRLLQDGLNRLLAERYGFEQRRKYMAEPHGWSRDLWGQYAEMGLLALPFSESDGGFGGGAVETMIVMEAFGRGLTLEPYLSTVVLSGGFLRLAGSPGQRASLIPLIADGRLLLAFAQAELQSRFDLADVSTVARLEGDEWVITGQKRHVLHGDSADKLIVTARTHGERRDRSGIGLFMVDAGQAGVSRRGYLTQDRQRAAEIGFDKVRVAPESVIGEPGAALPLIERVVDLATAAICAEGVGVMTRAHEIAIDYLKIRKQFGTTIGSFQALQHRAVDMLITVEQARSLAMYAAITSEEVDSLERRRAVSAAKAQIGSTGKHVCAEAIQFHGGIGMTDECQVGHYYRRLTMIDLLFGHSAHHLSALARAGGLSEPETDLVADPPRVAVSGR